MLRFGKRYTPSAVRVLLVSVLALLSNPALAAEAEFELLLEEGSLRYSHPSEFVLHGSEKTDGCNKRLDHSEGVIGICLMIRPISRMEVDYNDPHSSAPEPNQVYPLLFESLRNQLSRSGSSPSLHYSEEQAKEFFGADWAAAAVFTLEQAGANQHQEAFLVAFHKHNKADAYLLFTYTDPDVAKRLIKSSLSVLKFIE